MRVAVVEEEYLRVAGLSQLLQQSVAAVCCSSCSSQIAGSVLRCGSVSFCRCSLDILVPEVRYFSANKVSLELALERILKQRAR